MAKPISTQDPVLKELLAYLQGKRTERETTCAGYKAACEHIEQELKMLDQEIAIVKEALGVK